MARRSYLNVLDQIAKFFLLLSDAPSYWFTLNTTMTAMIDDDDNDDDDNDDDDDGYDDNGRQRWRRLPAQVPFNGAL
jgi:hypothetical protein